MPPKKKETQPSEGERIFMTYWEMFGWDAYPYTREFKFHPARNWRLDFAWIIELDESEWTLKIGAEVEGGAFSGGRHVRGQGYSDDLVKYNEAVLLGWKLLRYTPQQLQAAPDVCIGQILMLLRGE